VNCYHQRNGNSSSSSGSGGGIRRGETSTAIGEMLRIGETTRARRQTSLTGDMQ